MSVTAAVRWCAGGRSPLPMGEMPRRKVSECVAGVALTYVRTTTYDIMDRLHAGRSARVSADGIAATVPAWLAELGADSPLADDLARAARAGNWSRVHELEDWLSVGVTGAA